MTLSIEKAGYICQPRLDRWDGGIVTGWGETAVDAWGKMAAIGAMLPAMDCNIVPASRALIDMLDRCGGHCGTRHVLLNGVACTVSEVQDLRRALADEIRALEAAHNATSAALGFMPSY